MSAALFCLSSSLCWLAAVCSAAPEISSFSCSLVQAASPLKCASDTLPYTNRRPLEIVPIQVWPIDKATKPWLSKMPGIMHVTCRSISECGLGMIHILNQLGTKLKLRRQYTGPHWKQLASAVHPKYCTISFWSSNTLQVLCFAPQLASYRLDCCSTEPYSQ